jgi:membrane protein implicated in regulation of membrane protease activity
VVDLLRRRVTFAESADGTLVLRLDVDSEVRAYPMRATSPGHRELRRPRSLGRGAPLGLGITPFAREGQMKVNGEIWLARCEQQAPAGGAGPIRAADALTLDVEPG